MTDVLDIAVAALSMVLLVSGVLKVRDPDATTPMLRAVGLPSGRPVVYAVAGVELVVGAVTLVIGGVGPVLVLAALYAAFAVLAFVLVRSGADVSCGCFGQRSARMTSLHVVVDAGAAVVAATAAALGATGLASGTGERSVGVLLVAAVAAIVLAAAVVALLTVVPDRLAGGSPAAPADLALSPQGDGRAPGAAAVGQGRGVDALHPIEGLTPAGEPVRVVPSGSGRIVLVAFLTTGCTTCSHFWSVFGELDADDLPGDRTDLVIVARGDDREQPARVRDLAPAGHTVVRSSAAWDAYGVVAGPYFVLLDGAREVVLGEGSATAWADVEALVRQAATA